MTKKTKEIPESQREMLSTPALELKILENGFERTAKALKAKREQLGLPEYVTNVAKMERVPFLDAFTLGDDLDDERAVRAAGLLLEWAFGVHAGAGSNDDKDILARGIGAALSLAADQIAETKRRLTSLEKRTGNAD